MSYALIKAVARQTGLYRQARWAYRHVLNRDDLHRFKLERALYRPFIRPGDLCYDVGANYGVKTEVFLSLGALVVAFEPQPDCYDELRSRNPAAIAVNRAVGSRPGRAVMYVDPHRTGSSLLSDWRTDSERTIEVAVTTLDAAIDEYGCPSFCKIDVEGLEFDVLQGLHRTIPTLTFEFTRRRLSTALSCLDYLDALGTLEINFTPKDTPRFISEQWMTSHAARRFLEDVVARSTDFEWGDLFVQFRS